MLFEYACQNPQNLKLSIEMQCILCRTWSGWGGAYLSARAQDERVCDDCLDVLLRPSPDPRFFVCESCGQLEPMASQPDESLELCAGCFDHLWRHASVHGRGTRACRCGARRVGLHRTRDGWYRAKCAAYGTRECTLRTLRRVISCVVITLYWQRQTVERLYAPDGAGFARELRAFEAAFQATEGGSKAPFVPRESPESPAQLPRQANLHASEQDH